MNAIFDLTGVVIETPRLLIRPFRADDLDDFYAYAHVDGVGQPAGWLPHKDKAESRRILDHFLEGKHVFALERRADGRVIGSLGVEPYGMEEKLTEFDGYRGRELGFVLAKDCWGQGLMTEAVRAMIDYCFDTLDFDFLLCGHFLSNERSRHVQEKCGFRPYRRLTMDTRFGTQEEGNLNLLPNPKKNIRFVFSHPETLIWKDEKTDN